MSAVPPPCSASEVLGAEQVPDRPHRLLLLAGDGVVVAHGGGDVGEVAAALGRHDGGDLGAHPAGHRRQGALGGGESSLLQQAAQVLVERGDAVVVEPGGDGAEHRELFRVDVEALPVASHLAAHVAQRVLGASPLELVDDDDLGEVEHVDLLELARGAELGRHHVDRHVDVVDDPGVALPDAGRLHDHEVVPRRPARREDVVEGLGQLARPAGGQRAEQHLRRVDGVHADPVAEQRTTAAPPASDRRRARRSGACPPGRGGTAAPARR